MFKTIFLKRPNFITFREMSNNATGIVRAFKDDASHCYVGQVVFKKNDLLFFIDRQGRIKSEEICKGHVEEVDIELRVMRPGLT